MTEQEAIDVFEKPSDHIKTIQINHVTGIVYSADLVKAFEMAIEALEKQIPKKVIKEQGECYAMTKDGIGRYEIIVKCPSCGSTFLSPNFPCKCGQKLDWE